MITGVGAEGSEDGEEAADAAEEGHGDHRAGDEQRDQQREGADGDVRVAAPVA